ncbi:MAG: hypothetical protein ABR587_08345 [Candidatus Binatia bacterium]
MIAAVSVAMATLVGASDSRANSCSAGTSATVSRSTGGTCEAAMSLNQELTLQYRVRNASIVDSGPDDGTFVQSTIFDGSEIIGTLAQEDSEIDATPLPGVLTFIPVCPIGSVGGSLNPGDECNPMLAQCGSEVCGCESAVPGVTCTQHADPNKVRLRMTQDVVFAGNEQKNMATIRVRVTDLVGAPAVCGLFYTRSSSDGDILVITDPLCESQLTAGAQASADLHTSECVTDSDCGDPACNVCIENDSGNQCEPANLGSACGNDGNVTDCRTPACVDDDGTGVCEQGQNSSGEGLPCDNNNGVPVVAANCQDPICVEGVCELGPPLDCDDGVDCTTDACNMAGDGCDHFPDDSFCENDLFCDGDEICDVVNDCQPGTPPVCDDDVICTTDVCDDTIDDCVSTPDDSVCDNDTFCDGDEICDVTEDCQPGTPPNCDDGIVCTGDSCNEATDTCNHVADNSLCANGQFCDGNEICNPLSGCVPGIPVPCGDGVICSADVCNETTDACVHDFSPCVCGDNEVTGDEICDPPLTAGTFEDCNNGVDDDGDGAVDCRDTGCKPNARGPVCDENCELDQPCVVFIRDPARILFNSRGGPDEIYIHGRIPMSGEFRDVGRSMSFELSNPFGAIYRTSLGPGDMRGAVGGRYFRFRDKSAEFLGDASNRVGLSLVKLRTRRFSGVPHMVFTIRGYGDFSAANHYLMTTKLSAGAEVGYLTVEWTATPRGWLLHQVDFGVE